MHFFIKRIMKKIISVTIIFSLVYINNCSSIVEENDKPITQPVDIVWSKTGLDSCWVYSMVFMDNGDLFAGTSCGLLFSADSGASWSVANQVSFGTATCFYKQYTGRVFAGTSGQGLFTSSDNGISWNDLGLHNYNLTSIAVSSSGKVFVGTRGNGIFVADSLAFTYNELPEKKANPVLKFLTYFWGPIPWMIEAAAILSAIVKHSPYL